MSMQRATPARVAVLGAGPVGLEAALRCLERGLGVHLYERGDVAEHVSQWGHVRLFSPFAGVSTPAGLEAIRADNPKHPLPAPQEYLTGHQWRDQYLLPLATGTPLAGVIQLQTEVLRVGRAGLLRGDPADDPRRTQAPFRLLVKDAKGERIEEAEYVLDCTGAYRTPRPLGDGGIPAPGEQGCRNQVAWNLEDVLGSRKNHYANKSILVVGAGPSAASTVCQLATLAEEQPATWVIWVARTPRSTPLPRLASDPLRERDRLAARANSLATRGDGNLEYHGGCLIQSIESLGNDRGFSVTARCHGRPMHWAVDRVIACVGHEPDLELARALHTLRDDGGEPTRHPEPGYFTLGMRTQGARGGFLLKRGHEQVQEVLARLGGTKNGR